MSTKKDFLSWKDEASRKLEDVFFLKQDKLLIDNLRQKSASDKKKKKPTIKQVA